MRDLMRRTPSNGARRWRSGVLLLAGAVVLVSVVTGAALAANGGKTTPPGQAKKAATSTGAANAAHPATPAHRAKPTHQVKPTHPAKPAHPAHPTHPTHPAHPAQPSSPGKSADAQHHVIICHRTGSATNPYVVINISLRAWQHGHQTHPSLYGRDDILLQDPAKPGEKLPVSRCTAGTPSTTPTHEVVVVATTPGVQTVPGTATVGTPLVVVVHTTPNTTVTAHGAGVKAASGTLGATKTISDKRGVARLDVVPTKQGLLSVKVGRRVVKRFGVLGAHTSGKSLTG